MLVRLFFVALASVIGQPIPSAMPGAVDATASDAVFPDVVTAGVLLTAEPGSVTWQPEPGQWAAVRAGVHKVGVDWEILDERECRYVVSRPEDFAADVNLLRRRYQELKDAPRVAESFRFPDRHAVNDLVRFNRSFRKHLDLRYELETDRAEELRAVMRETDKLYQLWDAVRDARCEFYYVTVRRQALKKLKDMLGEDGYEHVDLPPCVPLWRFNEMRNP